MNWPYARIHSIFDRPNHVNVIGHDNMDIRRYFWVSDWDFGNKRIDDVPRRIQTHFTIHYFPEQMFTAMGA
jgi:hypothetical protein